MFRSMYSIEYYDDKGARTAAEDTPLPLLGAVRHAELGLEDYKARSWRIIHRGDGEQVCAGGRWN